VVTFARLLTLTVAVSLCAGVQPAHAAHDLVSHRGPVSVSEQSVAADLEIIQPRPAVLFGRPMRQTVLTPVVSHLPTGVRPAPLGERAPPRE
jgi:hypothetical protein